MSKLTKIHRNIKKKMVTVASESSATQLTNGHKFTPSTTNQTEKTRDKLRQSMSQQLLTNFTRSLRPRSSFLTPSCFVFFCFQYLLYCSRQQPNVSFFAFWLWFCIVSSQWFLSWLLHCGGALAPLLPLARKVPFLCSHQGPLHLDFACSPCICY